MNRWVYLAVLAFSLTALAIASLAPLQANSFHLAAETGGPLLER